MANKYKVGQEVVISTKELPDKKGVIRFIGKIQGKADQYVGIQLDQPIGKNNGDFQGKNYFKTEKISDKGQFYGVFVKPISIKAIAETTKKAPTTISGPGKVTKAPPVASGKNKLGNQLAEQQNSEVQKLKEQLETAYEKISQLQTLDSNKEIESLRSKLKETSDINRTLKLEIEQVRYKTDNNQQQKLKELTDKISFFQSQKDSGQKEKQELKKKIKRLEEELEESADREQMLEKLTLDVEQLQTKNQKLKSQLESAKTEAKNHKILGSGKGSEQLQQSITTLNEMVSLLQSDLNEQKEKNGRLQTQIQNNSTKLNDLVKLQRRLKSKDQEVEMFKIQLQTLSDAASFVQNLTFANLKKDQQLKELSKRLKEYAQKVNKYDTETTESQDMIDLQGQEMQHLEEQIQRHITQKQDKNKHIQLLNDQINKYKNKIRELTDNNSSLLLNMQDKDDETVLKTYFNTDIYQHKYYQLCKLNQQTQAYLLDYQLQMSSIGHFAGNYLANLVDTLPETYSSKLYPHIMNILVKISGTNHKLYLLFEIISNLLTNKSQLYAADQQNLVSWLLLLLDQIPLLYSSLLKIEFAIISADGQEDIMNIVTHPDLKEQVNRIDVFSQELLHRITTENIDIQGDFDPFIDPVEILDKIVLEVKRLPTELATRLDLCIQTMRCITQLLSSIQIYRRNSEARQSSQVDTMLQNFLKILQVYLRQCCTNSHIRLKNDMKSYLSGIDLVIKILKEIQLNDSLQELNSLYSDTDDIKMLKDTILTTQFHLKELNNDLQMITYSTPLSRIHVKLSGKLWQEKLREMREELLRSESTLFEKQELERVNAEQKKKILLCEKQIKDRQSTKELHERRIGELQLKVQQAGLLENDFKRQTEKLRSLEEANKLIEDQLVTQSRLKKELQEELKKNKQKFEIFQTGEMMKQRKQKNANNLSTEDISNLSVFKSVVTEAETLRNHIAKRKVHQIAFSPIMSQKPVASQKDSSKRREILKQLSIIKIGSDFSLLEKQVQKAEFQLPKKSIRQYSIGNLLMRVGQKSQIRIDLNYKSILSY